ncbi:MAG: hypothetical protein ACXVYC_15110 [Blastococcus sp.]
MSDLHCAATLIVVPGAEAGPEAARELARSLARRGVARVYSSSRGAASGWGSTVAQALDVDVVTLEALDDDPALSWVRTIADLHRGETVVVLTDRPTPWDDGGFGTVELSVDADGVVPR